MSGTALLDRFSTLSDPRQAGKVLYPLPEILLTVLCGTRAGAENLVEIERWATRKLDVLRRFLPFARGIASHDTLSDVPNALPAATFSSCFTAWVESLCEAAPDLVAIVLREPQDEERPPLDHGVVSHDDLMRLRTQHGPANMAAIRHVSLNLFKAITA